MHCYLYIYRSNTFTYVMKDLFMNFYSIESLSYCYSTVPQDPSFHHKVFKFAVAFSSNSFYFLHSPLHGLACCILGYQLMLDSFISQSLLNRFRCNLYYCLPCACSASAAIFRLIWSLKVVPECTLHSRVKDSRTQNSIIIFSSILRKYYNCYVNVNYDSTVLC